MYQIFDPVPVPAHLSWSVIPSGMLHCYGHSRFIFNMGSCEWIRELCTRGQILRPQASWELPQLQGGLAF